MEDVIKNFLEDILSQKFLKESELCFAVFIHILVSLLCYGIYYYNSKTPYPKLWLTNIDKNFPGVFVKNGTLKNGNGTLKNGAIILLEFNFVGSATIALIFAIIYGLLLH